jgi:glyoxylase-like metal-dependent hydrolase (beta-lactamase superfamily II)
MYATKVSERVYLLDTYAFGLPKNVGAYLIRGPKPTLVDCGYASSYENVLAGLAEAGVMATDVRYVIPTHVHLDHAGATGRLLREMPNAKVMAHEKSVKHLIDPTKLIESATKVFGEALVQMYGAPEPVPADRIMAVGEEASLDLGDGMTATVVHTPGHAPHQVSVNLDGTKALLTADAVGIVYPWLRVLIPTTPPPSFNPDELQASLRNLRQMTPGELLVPHFGTRKDADWVFDNTAEKVTSWVEKVRKMRNEGKSLDEASQALEKEVETEAGLDDLELYAKISIRTSVMGIMHYLEKSA